MFLLPSLLFHDETRPQIRSPSTESKFQMEKPSRSTILGFVFIFFNTMMCLLLLRTGYSSIIGSTKIDDIKVNSKQVNTCLGRYIYIHDLPKQFNEDVLENRHLITRKTDKFDMCM